MRSARTRGDDEVDNLFRADGHRVSHPLDWGDPETSLARVQFFDVLQACIERLPALSHAYS